jgi:hypothetical protein
VFGRASDPRKGHKLPFFEDIEKTISSIFLKISRSRKHAITHGLPAAPN